VLQQQAGAAAFTMAVVVTGGIKLGMMMARSNCDALCGTTLRMFSPSLTCKCQSSGAVKVSSVAADA
jgi:hypothetical protein